MLDEQAIERILSLPPGQRMIGCEARPITLSVAVHIEGEGLPEVAPACEPPVVGRFELNIPSELAPLHERLGELVEELEGDSSGDWGEERDPAGAAWQRCCRHYAGEIRKLLAEQVIVHTRPYLCDGIAVGDQGQPYAECGRKDSHDPHPLDTGSSGQGGASF